MLYVRLLQYIVADMMMTSSRVREVVRDERCARCGGRETRKDLGSWTVAKRTHTQTDNIKLPLVVYSSGPP
jgi:uncharacterized membrane protein